MTLQHGAPGRAARQAAISVAILILVATLGRRFEALFSELAKKNKVSLVPFILEGVGGERNLNLLDGIHPTSQGHKIIAANVWKVLEPVIKSLEAIDSAVNRGP